MRQTRHIMTARAPRRGMHEITAQVASWLASQGLREGLLTLFVQHTSASLLIQENADPDVQHDLEAWLDAAVPEKAGPGADVPYRHSAEGPDDMPAHIKSALTQTHLSIPIGEGRMMLGTWQGVYLFEHKRRPRDRQVILHLIGE